MVHPSSAERLKRLLSLEFPDDWMLIVLFTMLSAASHYPRAMSFLTVPMMVGVSSAILGISGAALLFKRAWGWLLMLVSLYLPITAILLAEGRYSSAGIYGLMGLICWRDYRRSLTGSRAHSRDLP